MKTLARFCMVFGVSACASPGAPPGGPVDTEAPQIVNVAPDSGKLGTTPRAVIFRFDEVVNERPSGAASLAALFLISPRTGEPRVDWNREEIAVRPRGGWRRNTAYTITMLPGLSDLRGNARNTGAVTMFSTGETLPAARIDGTLFNWTEARVISRGGLVQAWPRGDTTLVYLTTTDSAGAFSIATLPPGDYVVRGLSDDNTNRALDRREAWDTVAVALRDVATINLLAFIHDSLGTRLQSATIRDSVTVELNFDNPLSITQPLASSNIRVVASDSTDMGVTSVSLPPADTSAAARRIGRPIPTRSVIVKLSRPLRARGVYRIRVTDVHNLVEVRRSMDLQLTAPETIPVPPPPAPPRSTAPPAAAPPPPPAPGRR